MKPHVTVIACITLVCSCDDKHSSVAPGATERSGGGTGRIVVTSDNAPSNDDEALKIVGISMTPPPEVIYRSYEAGLDDNMKLVLRFSKDRMEEFWTGSPWSEDEARPASGDGSAPPSPRIPAFGDPKWLSWKASAAGRFATASLPNGEAVRVYLAEDLEEGFVHAFVFWHQT